MPFSDYIMGVQPPKVLSLLDHVEESSARVVQLPSPEVYQQIFRPLDIIPSSFHNPKIQAKASFQPALNIPIAR